jgi:hypothetical protein
MTTSLLVGWDKLALGERRPTIAARRWAGARSAVLSHPTTPRRGVVLIMVLVALGLTAVIGGALLQVGGMERSLLAAREQESQVRWLAESGVERAAAQLAADHGYAGETWLLAEEDLGGRGPGQVTILVEPNDANPGLRRVAVEAEFPSGATSPKRYTKQVELELKPRETAP